MSDTQPNRDMPVYQCHKKVRALKIKSVEPSPMSVVFDGGSWDITPEEDGHAPFAVPHAWYEKNRPEAGGYYVVYEDGYKSYSPAQAFESGYSRV